MATLFIIPCGKYKGETTEWLMNNDVSYAKYIVKMWTHPIDVVDDLQNRLQIIELHLDDFIKELRILYKEIRSIKTTELSTEIINEITDIINDTKTECNLQDKSNKEIKKIYELCDKINIVVFKKIEKKIKSYGNSHNK